MATLIFYKRKVDGLIENRKMVLDDERFLVSDDILTDDENSQSEILAKFPHLADQIAGGARFELQPNGSLMATFVPETQKEAYRFFAGNEIDCKNYALLRQEFNARKDALDDPGCKGCNYGKLIREFMPKVVAAIKLNNV